MGSLEGMLSDLRDGRGLLRNSYILAYFLSWDDRRRWKLLQIQPPYAVAAQISLCGLGICPTRTFVLGWLGGVFTYFFMHCTGIVQALEVMSYVALLRPRLLYIAMRILRQVHIAVPMPLVCRICQGINPLSG